METVPLTRRGFLASVGLALMSGVGCRTLDTCKSACGVETVSPMNGAQLVATWNSKVVTTADPTKGGEPLTGLAGRVYLFTEGLQSIQADQGSITVYLYDHSQVKRGGHSKLLEEWHFDPATLKRLQKKDAFGWGYTLFLPWGTYRPDIPIVHMQVVYEPNGGEPIHAQGQPLTLDHTTNEQVWQPVGAEKTEK